MIRSVMLMGLVMLVDLLMIYNKKLLMQERVDDLELNDPMLPVIVDEISADDLRDLPVVRFTADATAVVIEGDTLDVGGRALVQRLARAHAVQLHLSSEQLAYLTLGAQLQEAGTDVRIPLRSTGVSPSAIDAD